MRFTAEHCGDVVEIAQSGLFDADWYRATYPDVAAAGVDPLEHFVVFGWREGRDPGPLFSVRHYVETNGDVAEADVNPLVHYLRSGIPSLVRDAARRASDGIAAARPASREAPGIARDTKAPVQVVPTAPPTAPAGFPYGHFYSPIVDPADVGARRADIWPPEPRATLGIDWRDASHEQVLAEFFPRWLGDWDYPETLDDGCSAGGFHTRNGQFSWLDARCLFVLLRQYRPRRMIEVGAGYSSLLSADVNRRFLGGAMELTCIEPYPKPFLQRGVEGIARVIEERVERLDPSLFEPLEAGDVLFIDSSHVAKTGSDVNFLLFEVLPRLRPGVLVHFHDVFLPFEYPEAWVLAGKRSWNEQYVVRALLMHSTAFRVVFGCRNALHRFPALVAAALAHPRGVSYGGGSLWIERTGAPLPAR